MYYTVSPNQLFVLISTYKSTRFQHWIQPDSNIGSMQPKTVCNDLHIYNLTRFQRWIQHDFLFVFYLGQYKNNAASKFSLLF